MLTWGETEFNLLGLKFSVHLPQMIQLKYNKYILQAKDIIHHWNKRYLTPLGKVTVVKTYILSKFIHIFTSLPNPDGIIIKEIITLIFNFLWDGKPDKISRTQTIQPYSNGGLNLIHIKTSFQLLKYHGSPAYIKIIITPGQLCFKIV